MITIALSALLQVAAAGVAQLPAALTARDEIEYYWPSPREGQPGAFFRQLGAFSPPDRVVLGQCVPIGPGDADILKQFEQGVAADAPPAGRSALAWLHQACTSSGIGWPLSGPVAREEYIQVHGTGLDRDVIAALMHAVALQPASTEAQILLSRAVLRAVPGRFISWGWQYLPLFAVGAADQWEIRGGKPSVAGAADALYRAVRQGNASAETVRACTSLMIDVGDLATAHDCSMRALVAGSDSTWHELRLAWLAFRAGDTIAGARWFNRAAAAAHQAAARVELGWHFEASHDWRDSYASQNGWPPPGVQISTDSAELSRARAAKDRWLALPDAEFLGWVHTQATEHKRDGIWVFPTGSALRKHFLAITYNGSSFRDCDRHRDSLPPCGDAVAQERNDVVNLGARRYQLWDPASSEPLTLFVFSVDPRDLAISEMAGHRFIEVNARLTQYSPDVRSGQDTVIALQVAPSPDTTALVAGHVLARTGRSFSSWTFSMQQPRATIRGVKYVEEQPAIGSGPVALSDLVIGHADKRGILWRLGAENYYAAYPSAAIDHKASLHLYYQIRSDSVRGDLHSQIAIFRSGEKSAAVQVAAPAKVGRGVTEYEKEIDISRLKRGEYRIEVRLIDRTGAVDSRSVTVKVM